MILLGEKVLERIKYHSLKRTTTMEYRTFIDNRDFKIWYGEAVVRRQIVKITSAEVMSLVPQRLSRRSLAFYYGKVRSFTYSSLREYYAYCLITSHFNAVFTV